MNSSNNIQQFKEHMTGRVTESTLKMYVYSLNQFFAVIDGNVLTPEFAQRYVDSLAKSGKSPSTVGLRAHAIMSYFRYMKVNVHLDCPSIKVKTPEYLKPDEISRVIEACRTQLEKTVVVMLYDTAVRISELLNLTTDDIDWVVKTITVTRKGGRRQEVNISDKAVSELKNWLEVRQCAPKKVFLDLDYYTAWGIIRNVGKRAGITNVHPHIFRHSRAISMLKSGAKPYVVQQHLGHRSLATTMDIYGAFMATDLREDIPEW